MISDYIKSYPRNGHDITLQVSLGTGTAMLPDGGATEVTHSVAGALDDLSAKSISADASGPTVNSPDLANIHLVKITLPGGAVKYTNSFTKDFGSPIVVFTDGTTVVAGQVLSCAYLPDGAATQVDNIPEARLGDTISQMQQALETQADGATNIRINSLLQAIGFRTE